MHSKTSVQHFDIGPHDTGMPLSFAFPLEQLASRWSRSVGQELGDAHWGKQTLPTSPERAHQLISSAPKYDT